MKRKKIAVLAVGASAIDEKNIQGLKQQNLTKEMAMFELFSCRGMWDDQKLSFLDWALCQMMSKAISQQKNNSLEPW